MVIRYSIPQSISKSEKKNIITIIIKILTETFEECFIQDNLVTSPQLLPPTISGLDVYKEPRLQLRSFVNLKNLDQKFEFYEPVFSHRGNGFDIPVLRGIFRY